MTAITWHTAEFNTLSPLTLYRLLALRSAVFVVEQTCCYQDADGADLTALHLWAEQNGRLSPAVVFCLRRMTHHRQQSAVSWLIRSFADKNWAILMEAAISAVHQHHGQRQIHISAQAHLTAFYEKCGFTVCSEIYSEDGIPHCDMTRR